MSDAGEAVAATFRVLGRVRLERPEGETDLGPGKQCCLLACLLLEPGRPVPVDVLVDRLWETDPPKRARNLLATYATRLRGRVPPGLLTLRYAFGGYLAEVDPERVDVHAARRLIALADRAGGAGERAGLLHRALAGWHPVALAGVPGEWARRTREALHDERIAALTRWAEDQLTLAHPGPVVDELRVAVETAPFHEALHAQLIRALAAGGDKAAALGVYEEVARRLDAELGVRPGDQLFQAYVGIRAQPKPAATVTGPAQLPAGPADFTGRADELAALDRLTAGICVVHGMAGVGKTALAIQAGRYIRGRFSDGQLWVNLRGFDPAGAPLDPAVALHGFLEALLVPPDRIPARVAERSALFRSLLADRRVLVVLDNAGSADQVRPLLPGGDGCLVVITSREPLTSLVTTEHARPLRLGLLPPAEAHDFLLKRLGPARIAREPAAADELITRSARLPLALAIAAARAAIDDSFPLAALADELRTLAALDGGDTASDLRTVFSCSVRTLTPPAARLFRLLGLHPVPVLSPPAAASLAGAPVDGPLEELRRASLIERDRAGEITVHDLLHAYARELVLPDEEQAARRRLTGHYLRTAGLADRLLDPARTAIGEVPAPAGSTAEALADGDAAMAWFQRRHQPLLAVLADWRRTGLPAHTVRLAFHLTTFLMRRGHFQDEITSQLVALAAGQEIADRPAQARAYRAMARAEIQLGRPDEARRRLREAIAVGAGGDDRRGEANTHLVLAWLLDTQQRTEEARQEAERALALVAEPRSDLYPYALNALGWYEARVGRHAEALDHCAAAVALFAEAGDERGEAETQDSLGYIHQQRGDYAAAVTHYRRALTMYRALGDRHGQGETLTHLGDIYEAAGKPEPARAAWRQALHTLTEINHPTVDAVQARVDCRP